MPNRDGTGPEGKGPLTGRMRGRCKGAEPNPYRPGLGRGMGRRRRIGGRWEE